MDTFNPIFKQRFRSFINLISWAIFGGAIIYSCSTSRNEEASFEIEEAIPQVIDFNFHIKPIISDRCFKCHGPDPKTREAGLSLHTKKLAFGALGEKTKHFALVAGDTGNSTLIQRILSSDPGEVMPPPESNLTLSEREKQLLIKWVEQGAEWKPHWAFIPPKNSEVPEVGNSDWAKNEIDYFILKKLEEKSFKPSKIAPKEKLLRRVSFDLTGLPPTISELESFLNNASSDAFEKQVDRLLASPAYGERMAIDWMELARYADTHGYQDDFERIMWPWRDWVIHSFNKNQAYNEFVKWQLAGDLMPAASLEMIVATAFNRNHKITAEGGVIPEEYRTEYVADRGQTVSTAFMGLTMECSRCHDHKYDPITQKDYFSMFAFFNNIPEVGLIEMQDVAADPHIKISKKDIDGILSFINNRNDEEEIPLMVMREMKKPRKTFILNRGIYDQPLEQVDPATPEFIFDFDEGFSRDRLGLANWLFDERNPLTARVAVNRLWQQLFGQGIVSTPYDFGNQGALPSHPELLDFLAVKYEKEGWNTKKMLKYMVMSATYQQSSNATPEMVRKDPENQYLARASRLRLSAEMLRDQALQLSGLLNEEIGGPSVKPYQPEGLWKETTGGGGGSTAQYEIDSGNLVYRKSLYTFWKRTVPPPNMITFDAASRDLCTVKRQQTSTPLQALVLLNDPQFIEASRSLAEEALSNKSDPAEIMKFMFRRATSRMPSEEELLVLNEYFEEERVAFSNEPSRAKAYLAIGRSEVKSSLDTVELAAYAIVAHAILNLDEAITRG
ncbi:PSD1 and planctomycete cytochrome C domain-containing protein [Ekhidna sp.]